MEERMTAKNGIEIYSYKNPALHGFSISLFLRAGLMYEQENEQGITHFLEHVLIRNINKQKGGKLYATLDKHGVEFNAATYSEMVQFYTHGASANFSVGADVIASFFNPIILNASEIATERKRIKAEIRESDEKNSMASFSAAQVYADTSLAGSITGTNKSVDRITLTKLEEYRKRVFIKENLFIYVTGSFDDSDLSHLCDIVGSIELCEARTESDIHTNIAPVSRYFGKRDAMISVKNADYTSLRFTFDMDMASVDDNAADILYDMLLSGYSSPFFIEMSEERGLFYDTSGAVEKFKNVGNFYFGYEVKERDVYDAAAITVDILNDYAKNLRHPSEIIKAGYVDNALLLYDDMREFNFTMAYDNHIMDAGYKTLEDRIAAYRALTPERIRDTARALFRPENLTLTIKGSKKRIDIDRLKKIVNKLGE
jgi:predicted Zn-dependent peptidase